MGQNDDATLKKPGLSRRALIKRGAVAGGVGVAAVWVAPNIETFRFAPAFAAGSGIIVLSAEAQDMNSNQGSSYCSGGVDCVAGTATPGGSGTGCDPDESSFGASGNAPDVFTFANPIAGCTTVLVRTIALDCTSSEYNPDVGNFALVISSKTGTCNCVVLEGVLIQPSGRVELHTMNRGSSTCLLGGIDSSLFCNDSQYDSGARLAVRIRCTTGP